MKTCSKYSSLLAIALLFCVSSNYIFADDTEVYITGSTINADELRPNVVFVLDTSGSMGFPVSPHGANRWQEFNRYDPETTYTGSANISGGVGDPDYYYLYKRHTESYADQYIYHNKFHKDQLTINDEGEPSCNMVDVDNSSIAYRRYRWYQYIIGSTGIRMCRQDDNCDNYTAGPLGPKVRCGGGGSNQRLAVSANFHNYLQSYYRYAVLQRVMRDLIDRPFDINMSIMRFDGGHGGYVIKESVDANVDTNQTSLRTAVNNMTFIGLTPLTETLWEAALYLRGQAPLFGDKSVAASRDGSRYQTPIEHTCQKSHIILLTDGAPTNDGNRDIAISTLTGNRCRHSDYANAANESCLDDFARWLHIDGSERRDHSSTPTTTGIQPITVHTIGFGLDNPLLTATAGAGNVNGLSLISSTADELSTAFNRILDRVEFEKDTFVAPAVAVNAYNGLQHRNELYFALFKPNGSPRWQGNIKKYQLDGDTINDRNGNPAINPDTGYFYDSSQSFWTSPTDLDNDGIVDFTTDGSKIEHGGIATLNSDPTARTVYTYTPNSAPRNISLSERLDTANSNITNAMLGVDTTAERDAIINWARGGVTNTPSVNYYMADFVHNSPAVVTYQTIKTTDADGNVTAVSFDDTIYASSNLGFFHAIDADDGHEVFSFVPRNMFGNLRVYYNDIGRFSDKVYGLDAPMSVWRFDEDNDGNIINTNGTVDGNDYVHIYQGLRRGGTTLYAFDVTLRNNPLLMWQINGQAYGDTPRGDFRNLAETWSVPQRGKIKWDCNTGGCSDKNVLFFGGGYDRAYDTTASSPATTAKGNAIYMVDADTGALLWSAGNGTHHTVNFGAMTNSIPADVTAGDIDGDGYIDFLFAVDIRGGVWRIDLSSNPSSATTLATGGKIADLGGGGTDFRRFYNAPDVAFHARRGGAPFLSISIASGYRAHPREIVVDDFIYVVFDQYALTSPPLNNYNYVNSTQLILPSHLGNAPSHTQHGWQKAFSAEGEKGLSRTVTFGNQIIMTSYTPEATTTCVGSSGKGRRYLMDVFTGASLLRDTDDTVLEFIDLIHGGIPPEPAVIYSSEEACTANCDDDDVTNDLLEERTNLIVCIGTECIDDVVDQKLHRMFWREN